MGEWKTIDTAPMNGDVHLICVHEFGKPENPLITVVARWREGFWREELNDDHIDDTARTWEPIYWMPLPDAPTNSKEG